MLRFVFHFYRLEEPNNSCRSVTELPESLTSLMPCVEPPSRPSSPAYPTFELSSEQELPQNIRDENATWIVSRTLTGHDVPSDDDNDEPPVPVWSAYNSLVNDALPVTRVGAPPLLAHPAHEWSTLLTVLMRAQNISVRVVGPGRKSHIARPWLVSARQTITDGPVRAQEHSPSTRGAACGYGFAEDHWVIY